MSIQPNETHAYLSRGAARDSAINAGLDLDDLHICRLDTGDGEMKWGWVSADERYADEAEKEAEATFGPMESDTDEDETSVESIMARNAGRIGESLDDVMAHNEADPLVVEAMDEAVATMFSPPADDGSDVEAAETLLPPDAATYQGDVYLRTGPFLFFRAKAAAQKKAKQDKCDVEVVTPTGLVLFAVSADGSTKAKAERAPKPARPAPLGEQVDGFDRPVRPVITQEKWIKTCAGHFDRIEAIAGDAAKLLDYQDSINPGDTYRQIIHRYAKNHRRYATKYGRSPFAPEATRDVAANWNEPMAEAAD